MPNSSPSRRSFLKTSTVSGAGVLVASNLPASLQPPHADAIGVEPVLANRALNLSPATWIWYPCERVLQNTVLLFRRQIKINNAVKKAHGWILGDSRYKLFVNDQYVQFGPAPADPRWPEADPIDLTAFLQSGDNAVGAQVLYYGQGDGTWPMGKPGFIFYLEIEFENGQSQLIVSDQSWQTCIATSWQPGHYKRWYLRAFQEEFDARRYPYGWTAPAFQPSADWLPAMELAGDADKPALATNAPDYLTNSGGLNADTQLRARSIPLMKEKVVPAVRLAESHWLRWKRPVREYFDCLTPNAFQGLSGPAARAVDHGWSIDLSDGTYAVLTFEFADQLVGWPFFDIDAPAGTTIELMVQEAHEPFGSSDRAPALMNNKFHSWTRFVCRDGKNQCESFDYESFRWLQLHIYNASGRVHVSNVGARQRFYDWPHQATVNVSDDKVQKVINAAINTMYCSGQDIIVDGMARERQQYSGDIGHFLHASLLGFGAQQQAARYLNTYSQGLTKEGYFMDCWPAYDRLNRIAQRQLDLTPWGPLVDHGVGFNFDCYYYYMYTGDLAALDEVFPRLVRFYVYLKNLIREDGLLPTDDLGTPTVWIEHGVSKRHIQCSFNLYAAAMMKNAFAVLADAKGESRIAADAIRTSDFILKNTIKKFWSPAHGLFVSNLPWFDEEGQIRLHDRTLATAILFDMCPNKNTAASIKALVDRPTNLHLSYPANAGWYMWALAKSGRADKIIDDLKGRWYDMPSVLQNNTLGEWFELKPDSHDQWCHAPVAPLYTMYMNIAGITPLSPGMTRIEIRPQLAQLEKLNIVAHSPLGEIRLRGEGKRGQRRMAIELPRGCVAELVVSEKEKLDFEKLKTENGVHRYKVQGHFTFNLKFS